jgi:hypothetical protein
MSLALGILMAGWIAYALIRAGDRPGLFGGVTLATYGFSTTLGSIGGPIGLIALLLALAQLARRGDRPPLAAELGLAGWAMLSLASVFYARDIDSALQGAQFLVAFAGSAYLYGRAFGDRPGFWQDVALASGLSLVLCEPGLLAQGPLKARMSGNLTAVGISLLVDAPAVACLTVLILDETLRWRRFAAVAGALLLVLTPIALSFGTRGTFVGAGAAAALALARRLRAPQGERFLLRFAGATVAIALAALTARSMLWAAGAYKFVIASSRAMHSFSRSGGKVDTSALERLAHWRAAWSLTQDAPLFGHGLFAFGTLADNAGGDTPHNMFLEILVSTGFAGLALFLLGLVPIARAGLRRLFAEPLDIGTAFAVCLLADALVRFQLSSTPLAARSLFLAMGVIVARCHPGRVPAWRAAPAHDMVAP